MCIHATGRGVSEGCLYHREEEESDRAKGPIVMGKQITQERVVSYGDDRTIIQEVIDYANARRSRLTRANLKRSSEILNFGDLANFTCHPAMPISSLPSFIYLAFHTAPNISSFIVLQTMRASPSRRRNIFFVSFLFALPFSHVSSQLR